MHKPESFLKNETELGFLDRNGSPNLDQTTRPYNNQQQQQQQQQQNKEKCGLCCPG